MLKKPQIKSVFALFVALIVALFVTLRIADPAILIGISQEDVFLENLTAGVLFATFCLSSFLHLKFKVKTNIFFAIAILGLIGFLDEISFGRRLLPIPMPKSHGLTIDGVHDLLHLLKNITRTNLTYHPVGTYIVISLSTIFAVCVWHKTKVIRQRVFSLLRKYEIRDLVLVIISCIVLSQVVDTFRWNLIYPYIAVEECLELTAAVALLTCSLKCREKIRLERLK